MSGWQLDKHIPVAGVLALLIQSATIVWWASGINARVTSLETQIARTSTIESRVVRLETLIGEIHAGQLRMEAKLDRLLGAGFRGGR